MQCNFCGKEVSSAVSLGQDGKGFFSMICDTCHFLLTGTKANDIHTDYYYNTFDGIVLAIKDLKVKSVWIDNGTTCFKLPEDFPKEAVKIIDYCRAAIKKELRPCCKCGKLLPVKELSRHMGSVFCPEHWKEYQRKNSIRCGNCKKPLYECTC